MNNAKQWDHSDGVEFLPAALEDEIKRGMLIEHTYHPSGQANSYRCYTDFEQRLLSIEGRDYLLQLEQGGYISSLQREWIIESVLTNTEIAHLDAVPVPLLVATVFLVLLLGNLSHANFSVPLSQLQEVSLRVH
tara:strand:+ start:131 stop:532 length:402 start_codon:yes stop_codon:yes gene_type:complete